jgi:hypothetical protein
VAGQILRPFSLGDVVVGFQDSGWPSALVLPQGPPARHGNLRSVSLRMDEFPFGDLVGPGVDDGMAVDIPGGGDDALFEFLVTAITRLGRG